MHEMRQHGEFAGCPDTNTRQELTDPGSTDGLASRQPTGGSPGAGPLPRPVAQFTFDQFSVARLPPVAQMGEFGLSTFVARCV